MKIPKVGGIKTVIMSTIYGIFEEEIERTEDGCAVFIEKDDYGADYFIIGKTHGFTFEGEIIQKHLKDDTPVYALDNDSKIRTIKDLREYYK